MLQLHHTHQWNVSPTEAITIQQNLKEKLQLKDHLSEVNYVAGVDVGFEQYNTITRAAVVVLTYPELQLHEFTLEKEPTVFPYIPGLLSFREVPTILKSLEKIKQLPDLILCDGQGTAHPRRLGLACHLGLLTDIPTIGVAKSRLIGTYPDLPREKASWVPLSHKDEVIGAVLRTRTDVNPLFISPGHKISLETSITYTLNCTTKYKLPETTRWAHKIASNKL